MRSPSYICISPNVARQRLGKHVRRPLLGNESLKMSPLQGLHMEE
jgi:hypothetical protein